jgi:hypothetical protein
MTVAGRQGLGELTTRMLNPNTNQGVRGIYRKLEFIHAQWEILLVGEIRQKRESSMKQSVQQGLFLDNRINKTIVNRSTLSGYDRPIGLRMDRYNTRLQTVTIRYTRSSVITTV